MVVACTGHTCINRTSFRLLNMPDFTIAVGQRCRKALARKAKNPIRLSVMVMCHNVSTFGHPKEREYDPCQCLCMYSPPPIMSVIVGKMLREQFSNVRGPCCSNNKLQIYFMILTSSPRAKRKRWQVKLFGQTTQEKVEIISWLLRFCFLRQL